MRTEDFVSQLDSEEAVRHYGYSQARRWFLGLPQKKGDESMVNRNEGLLMGIGAVCTAAAIHYSNQVTESYQNMMLNPYWMIGENGVPPEVAFWLKMMMLAAVTPLLFGVGSAWGRVRVQRLVNWWEENRELDTLIHVEK